MPPLSHGTPERQNDPELRELIAQAERSICFQADVIVQQTRDEEYNQLSGFKAALHHRKAVNTESVRYETAEHSGDYGIRAMLTDYGSKKKDTVSLLTKVVRDIKSPSEDDTIIGEGSMGFWVERIRFSGNIISGYNMTICDVDRRLLTPEKQLSLLKDVKETVNLIADQHYSRQLEVQN